MKVENNLPEPFIHNEYYEKMMAIINKAKLNPPKKHFEIHHIIPRCYYKLHNHKIVNGDNLVRLSYSDHILVHFFFAFCAVDEIKYKMRLTANLMLRINDISILPKDFIYQYAKEIEDIKINTHDGYFLKCNETGKLYHSVTECAFDMGLNEKAVLNALCVNQGRWKVRGYSFSYLDKEKQKVIDERIKKAKNKSEKAIKDNYKNMAVNFGRKVIHLETGVIYNSIQHCNRALNVHCDNSCYSKNHVSRLGHFMFYDEYVKNPVDYKTLPTFEDAHKATTVYAQQKAKKKVRCIETGEIFNSCEDVRKKYGVRVDRCINPFTSKGKLKNLKYHFEYIKE